MHDLLRMPYYHPTIEEGLRAALRGICRKLPECSISDLARCGPLGAEALESRVQHGSSWIYGHCPWHRDERRPQGVAED